MAHLTITSLNEQLIVANRQLTIREYLLEVDTQVFCENIAEFANDLLDLVQKDDCCIPHDRLIKYGVLADNCTSNNVLRLFEQYELEQDIDYILLDVEQNRRGAGRPKKSYLLHPDAFELCLMRAKNTRRYARFYSLLRKTVVSYEKYQRAQAQTRVAWLSAENTELKDQFVELRRLNEKMLALNGKCHDKIDELHMQNGQLHAQNGKLHSKVDGLHAQNGKLHGKIDELHDKVDDIQVVAEEILGTVDDVRELAVAYAGEAVVRPPTSGKTEALALVSVTDDRDVTQLCVIRCQSRGLTAQVSKHKRRVQDEAKARARQAAADQGLEGPEQMRSAMRAASKVCARTVFAIHDVPNVRYLWDRVQRDAGNRLEALPGTPARIRLHGISLEELEALARQINAEPEAQCAETATAVKEEAARALLQVNIGPVTVNNVQVVVAPQGPKPTNEDFEAFLAAYLEDFLK